MDLNGPKGLGDAIYLRAVALHCLDRGDRVTVHTPWPEVFAGLPIKVKPAEVSKDEYHHLSHVTACLHCQVPQIQALDKFRLACLQAGISEPVELRLDWVVRNPAFVREVMNKANGRPVMLCQPLNDKPGRPDASEYRRLIERYSDYYRVKVGGRKFIQDDDTPCELDLFGKTSVSDVFDLAKSSNLIVGEQNYLPLLAQALNIPFVMMFSRRAMESPNKKLSGVRPERLIVKPHLGQAVF